MRERYESPFVSGYCGNCGDALFDDNTTLCSCDTVGEFDGFLSNDRDELALIDHTKDCIMGDAPECNCPRASVRIIL
jgi:hypothetical protein